MNERKIKIIDRIFVIASAIIVIALAIFMILNNLNNNNILFKFRDANVIFIDDNENFESPLKVDVGDNSLIELKKGISYWKIIGNESEKIIKYEINKDGSFKIRQNGEEYEVINNMKEILDVDVYENGKFTGKIVLGGKDE